MVFRNEPTTFGSPLRPSLLSVGTPTAPTLKQRVVWLMAAALLALYAAAALAGSIAPFYGGLSYNPEFDGLFMPIGLFAAYGSLCCFRRAFPHLPWIGEPSLDQG